MESYYPQIDFLKGVAIISVLFLHIIPGVHLSRFYSGLTISQAVPVFFIIFAITTTISLQKNDFKTFFDLFSKDQIKRKMRRYLYPFLLISMISIFITYFVHFRNFDLISIFIDFCLSFIGVFPPSGGPGDYFVSDLIQLIIVAPVVYYCMKKSPQKFLVFFLFMNLLFELVAPTFPLYDMMYRRCIFRYLGLIALGFYISDDFLKNMYIDLKEKKYRWMIPLSAFSFLYLIYFNANSFYLFRPEWITQNILSFFYPVLLVILILNYYTKISRKIGKKIITPFLLLGRASYHIFVVQIFYFVYISPSIIQNLQPYNLPFIWSACFIVIAGLATPILFGLAFFKYDNSIFNFFKIGISN